MEDLITCRDRKLKFEFVDDYEGMKTKTSRGKKTLHGVLNFINERIKIEQSYSEKLLKLSQTTGPTFKNFNLSEYKKYEENGMQDLLNSLIESTIQQGQTHEDFAHNLKVNCVPILDYCLEECRKHKDEWINTIDSYHKDSTKVSKKVDSLKKNKEKYERELAAAENKKERILDKYDLGYEYDPQEAPKDLLSLDKKINSLNDKISNVLINLKFQSGDDQEKEDKLRETFQILLEGIEDTEVKRMEDIKSSLTYFSQCIKDMRNSLYDEENKLIDSIDEFSPQTDLQNYIQRRSPYQDPDEISNLYRMHGFNLVSKEDCNNENIDMPGKSFTELRPDQNKGIDLTSSDDEETIETSNKNDDANLLKKAVSYPDEETKEMQGAQPILVESMSIVELPVEYK